MRFDFRDITTMSEYLPTERFKELIGDGVRLNLKTAPNYTNMWLSSTKIFQTE